jgi:hypothetical protein
MLHYIRDAYNFILSLKLEDVFKIAAVFISISFMWPVIQPFGKVYDITLINRLTDECYFTTLRAKTGDPHVKGASDDKIDSNEAFHYQIVPRWTDVLTQLFGPSTLHIRVKRNDSISVIIPVYNQGDIQRSQVFFIEKAGVREFGTTEKDAWTWNKDHHFGQQGN